MKADVAFTITYRDGPAQRGTIRLLDFVAAERHFERSVILLEYQRSTELTLWLAWNALRRVGELTEEFDPWMERVKEYDETEKATKKTTNSGKPARPIKRAPR